MSALATTQGGDVTELAELYRALAARLEQMVRLGVRAPEPVIEDACQTAWSRFVRRREGVHLETALQWLTRTAVREAVKSVRRHHRELPLDDVLADADEPALSLHAASAHELAEQRERLATVAQLPARQQRLVWLHALGLTYAEMALHEGCSPRTVERQLLRAKKRVRSLAPE
jgi:RNA polymerase sigma factor (sigma-70 family)